MSGSVAIAPRNDAGGQNAGASADGRSLGGAWESGSAGSELGRYREELVGMLKKALKEGGAVAAGGDRYVEC